jgi:hypothetical protein
MSNALCPAAQGLLAAFVSDSSGPPDNNPIALEKVLAMAIEDGQYCVLVIDKRGETGVARADDFEGYLGVMVAGDQERFQELTNAAIEWRKENS